MGFRKIIGFGDSSFVVSLPKNWVVKNGLKKGDDVSVEEDGFWLKIGPHTTRPSQEKREINIDYKDIKDLKSRLVYAYINNYGVINIKKANIEGYVPQIKSVVSNFVGLDAVEQRKDRVIVNDVLDISGMSIHNLLRRMDRIVLSMVEDVKLILEGKKEKTTVLDHKDDDVNKICNLILKLLRRAHNVNDMRVLNLEVDEIFYYWDIALNMEDIADQLKRIIRLHKGIADSEIIKMFDIAVGHYTIIMKANYTKDSELAVSVIMQRKEFSTKCDKLGETLTHDQILILEKIKAIHNFSGNMAKILLKLGMPYK